MGQSFRCGARYPFVDCGHKVKVNILSITGSSGLCCFKGPVWTNHSCLVSSTLAGFRFPHLHPPGPKSSCLTVFSLSPRISYLKCHEQTRVCVSGYMQAFTAQCLWHSLLLKKPVLVEKKITGMDILLLMHVIS